MEPEPTPTSAPDDDDEASAGASGEPCPLVARASAQSLPTPERSSQESVQLRGVTHVGFFYPHPPARAYHFTSASASTPSPTSVAGGQQLPVRWLERGFDWALPAGSIRGSVFNLCSATMGAGILSLAYGFKMAGVLPGLLMLVSAGLLTVYSIWLLVDVYERTGIRTYEESTERILGFRCRRAVEVLTIAYCFGSAVAYVVVIGDVLAPLAAAATPPLWWLTRRRLMAGFWAACMLPASCLREISSLRYTSFCSVLCICYVTLVISALGVAAWASGSSSGGSTSWSEVRWVSPDGWKVCLSMPITLFAYSCQVNVFAIYDELADRRPATMVRVSVGSLLLCFSVYVLAGLMGYLHFQAQTRGDIFENLAFAQPSPLPVTAAFVAMACAVTLSFPLSVFPLRTALNLWLFEQPQLRSPLSHFVQTLGLCAAVLVVAMEVPGVHVVFQLVGSVTAASLCYVFPAVLGITAGCSKDSLLHAALVWTLAGVGTFVGVAGTVTTVWSLASEWKS